MDARTGLPVVGMVGAGQLARMTHQAAIALGQSLRILAESPEDGAALVFETDGAAFGTLVVSPFNFVTFAEHWDGTTWAIQTTLSGSSFFGPPATHRGLYARRWE